MKLQMKKVFTPPNICTFIRIVGTLCLFLTEPLTLPFFIVYGICGVSDVVDGTLARLTNTETAFGAKLDSIADILFYGVMIIRLLPNLIALFYAACVDAYCGSRIRSSLLIHCRRNKIQKVRFASHSDEQNNGACGVYRSVHTKFDVCAVVLHRSCDYRVYRVRGRAADPHLFKRMPHGKRRTARTYFSKTRTAKSAGASDKKYRNRIEKT